MFSLSCNEAEGFLLVLSIDFVSTAKHDIRYNPK